MAVSQEALFGNGRVLVTGATGLVGNNVTRLLVARGYRVRVLTRPQSETADNFYFRQVLFCYRGFCLNGNNRYGAFRNSGPACGRFKGHGCSGE